MPANYDFSYDVQDNAVNLDFGHNEKRKEDQASGSYHVLLPDGRTQLIEYEAGPDGYKPQVILNLQSKLYVYKDVTSLFMQIYATSVFTLLTLSDTDLASMEAVYALS